MKDLFKWEVGDMIAHKQVPECGIRITQRYYDIDWEQFRYKLGDTSLSIDDVHTFYDYYCGE